MPYLPLCKFQIINYFSFTSEFKKNSLKLFLALEQDILSVVAKVAPWHIFYSLQKNP